MIIINSLNESRFTLNNVQYFKNYTTRVAGDKLTIYNAYDNKDVLVPLTPLDQFRINGSVYETIDELQIAIIGICYTRTTLEEGSPSSQNNVARLLSIGIVDIIGSDINATSTFYAESVAAKLSTIEFTITATEAPVIVYAVIDDNGDGINSLYSYFFTGGKGTYTNVLSYQLLYINDKKYTVDDIENNPTANIISLGDLPTGDYLTKANSVQRDFNDAGELDENGNLISYYLSYTTDNVLYFVQFVGAAGSYNGTLTANDFVSTTNSNVVADINYENVLQTGNFASIGAIHKDADSGMITEFHGSGFGSTLGDYTQKFLVDTPIGDYTITFPAATQNDNVVYESTLHEGLNSLGLQAVIDNDSTATHNDDIIITMDDGSDISKLSMIGDLLKLQLNDSSLSIDDNGAHFNTTVSGIDATANNEFATLGQVNQAINNFTENQSFSDVLAVNDTVYRDYYEDYFVLKNTSEPDAYIKVYADDEWLMNLKLNDGNGNETFIHTNGLKFTYNYGSGGAILNDGGFQLYNQEGGGVTYKRNGIVIPTNNYNFKANYSNLYADYGFEIESAPNIYYNQIQENDSIYFRAIPNITEGVPWVASGSPYWEIKGDLNIVNSDNPNSRGISGDVDFTSNIQDLDYVQKKYVDEQIGNAIQDLQNVTDTGATTTNAITAGGLTIPDNTLNITGGSIYNFIRGNGTTGDFIYTVNQATLISHTTTEGSTEQIGSGTFVRNAFYQLQNQINTNADNTIPLSGTEVGSPVTGDIEFEDGQFLQLKQGNGYIAFTDDDRIEIDIDGSGFDFGGSSATIRNATGSIDIAAGIDSKGLSGGHDYTSNITDLDYVQKKYVDNVAIQDLQNVTDTGATTTNAITTGGLTIPENTLNITGGSSNDYIKGNGTTGIFVADVRTTTMGTDNTAGSTSPLSLNSQITNAIYRLQNMINANADNTIPLTGTEASNPITGDIEFDASTTIGIKADAGGQITFNNTDGVRIQGNAGGVSIGGNTLGIAIEGEGGDIDISVGSDSKISLNGNLNHDGDGQNSIFYANGGQYEFGGNGNFKGIEYTEDYSSNYTNRSLVDKEYVDEHSPRILHNSVTDSTPLTGTTDDTILKSFLIPAGTISDGILSFTGIFEKAGAADQVSYRVSINTTNSISGSTRIATLVPSSANHLYSYFGRELIVNGNSIYGYPKFSDSNTGEQDASSSSSATLDTAADFYVIVSAALNDATDSVTQKSFKINFEKATE